MISSFKDTSKTFLSNISRNLKLQNILLLFVPVSFIIDLSGGSRLFLFAATCLSVIPLAGMLGDITEQISLVTGPKAGGLLNATTGNIPELFIGIFSIRAGMFSLVKASIVGSICGNMLLVLGFSIFFGGLKFKSQSFDKAVARTNFGMLFLALIGFIIPTAYGLLDSGASSNIYGLSFGISIILIAIYLIGLFYSLHTGRNVFIKSEDGKQIEKAKWKIQRSLLYLILCSGILAYESGLLVDSIESIKNVYSISEVFLGIVVIPIIGNIAEYTSAVMMAMKNKVNLSIEIAVGSGMQMALFVAPVLILLSTFWGLKMGLTFSLFQIITVTCSIGLSLYIFQDGKTNWLEGVELLSAYIIVALAYFFTS